MRCRASSVCFHTAWLWRVTKEHSSGLKSLDDQRGFCFVFESRKRFGHLWFIALLRLLRNLIYMSKKQNKILRNIRIFCSFLFVFNQHLLFVDVEPWFQIYTFWGQPYISLKPWQSNGIIKIVDCSTHCVAAKNILNRISLKHIFKIFWDICFVSWSNWKCAKYLTTNVENYSYRKIAQPSFLDTFRLWILAGSKMPGTGKEEKDSSWKWREFGVWSSTWEYRLDRESLANEERLAAWGLQTRFGVWSNSEATPRILKLML